MNSVLDLQSSDLLRKAKKGKKSSKNQPRPITYICNNSIGTVYFPAY